MYKSKYEELNYMLYAEAQFLQICFMFSNRAGFDIQRLLEFLFTIANLAKEDLYTAQSKSLVMKAIRHAPKKIAKGYWVLMLTNLNYSPYQITKILGVSYSSVKHHLGDGEHRPRAEVLPPHWIYNLTAKDHRTMVILIETIIDLKEVLVLNEYNSPTE